MSTGNGPSKQNAVLILLGVLMISHLSFLGVVSRSCSVSIGEGNREECVNAAGTFQRAAETYVAILLALMTPLATK